jgi:hypothetical protein
MEFSLVAQSVYVKFSLCLIKHHAKKRERERGGVGPQSTTWALDGANGSTPSLMDSLYAFECVLSIPAAKGTTDNLVASA